MAGRFSVESVFKAVDKVTGPVTRMQASVHKLGRALSTGLTAANAQIDKLGRGLASGAGAMAKWAGVGLGAATGAVTLFVREFSKIEDAEAAFTPLLGGADRAREAVEALNKAAAATPFQFEDLAGSMNQLLPVMNGDIERTIKTLTMLGDTAGGNAQKLDSITRGYTKAMLKGKVDMESLNMIAEAGVPIFEDLAAVMGTKVGDKFFKDISAGKVTTEQLNKAFEKLTGEGGKFFKGMDIASRTTSGMWSTLMDNISMAAAEIGGALAPVIKDLIADATVIAGKVQEWAKQNRGLIAGKFREFVTSARNAVVKLFESVQRFSAKYDLPALLGRTVTALADMVEWLGENGDLLKKVGLSVLALVVALKLLAAGMLIVNIVMAANPIGLIVLGITALIAAVTAVIIWWDELKAAFEATPTWIKVVAAAVALLFGPVGWLIAAALFVMDNWEGLSEFFTNLLGGIKEQFDAFVAYLTGVFDKITGFYQGAFELGASIGEKIGGVFSDDEEQTAGGAGGAAVAAGPGDGSMLMVSPQERVSRSIEERSSTNTSEVVIKDATGKASAPKGLAPGVKMTKTGAF